MNTRKIDSILATVLLTACATVPSFGAAISRATPLPTSFTLRPQYERLNLPAQAQQGPNCWAYSIVGCLELELSRAAGKTVNLSSPYLVWAAARTDLDTFDPRGSNFGRAARALERFGISEQTDALRIDIDTPLRSSVGTVVRERAMLLGRNLTIDWIRFWKQPLGLDEAQIRSVKEHIANGHPVAIGMFWPKNLTVADEATCLLGTCTSLDETADGHCVTLVGYEDDDRLPGGGAFVIRNTAGPNWMSNGYARLSYQYIRQFGNDVISFAMNEHAPGRFLPNGRVPTNATNSAVANLRAERCSPDAGSTVHYDRMDRYRTHLWQSDDQVLYEPGGRKAGVSVTIEAPRPGTYEILIAGTRGPDYGTYSVLADGKPVCPAIDFRWPSVEPTGEIRLGQAQLTKGRHALRFECTNETSASSGRMLGIDWVRLKPVTDAADVAG